MLLLSESDLVKAYIYTCIHSFTHSLTHSLTHSNADMPGILNTLVTKHRDYLQEEEEEKTHHGVHFGKGIALVLVVVEHVVHPPLLGQSRNSSLAPP